MSCSLRFCQEIVCWLVQSEEHGHVIIIIVLDVACQTDISCGVWANFKSHKCKSLKLWAIWVQLRNRYMPKRKCLFLTPKAAFFVTKLFSDVFTYLGRKFPWGAPDNNELPNSAIEENHPNHSNINRNSASTMLECIGFNQRGQHRLLQK